MARVRLAVSLGAAALLALTGCAAGSANPASSPISAWPTSMVVLGHSGATGWNSDPANPEQDAPYNSWATGTSADVDSIYSRALAHSPELDGHNFTVAKAGSDVDDLPRQVTAALALSPLPDLFIIQSVDKDIKCDGTDDANYAAYRTKIAAVLASINNAAPRARIFTVGIWSTVQNYSDVTSAIPAAVTRNQGGGLCDVFDSSGNEIPTAIATYQSIVDNYQKQLRESCAAAKNCVFGGDEILAMVIDANDLAPDTNHLSVTGLHKMASVGWDALDLEAAASTGPGATP
jgi:hypothetical protein